MTSTNHLNSISAQIIKDHGATFFESLDTSPNTKGQIFFLKAYSTAATYTEVADRLNKEGILTLVGREWTPSRVTSRASYLRQKGVTLSYLSTSMNRRDTVNYKFLKAFSERL